MTTQWNEWLAQSDRGPVVVVFYAPWSAAREIMDTFLEKIKVAHPQLKIAWVDVENAAPLVNRLGVSTVPTTKIIRRHEIVDVIHGTLPRRKLEARITKHL